MRTTTVNCVLVVLLLGVPASVYPQNSGSASPSQAAPACDNPPCATVYCGDHPCNSKPGTPPPGMPTIDHDTWMKMAAKDPPPHVLYFFLFTDLVERQQAAARVKARGKDDSYYRTVYSREAGLTDEEGATLNEIALDWRRQQDAIEVKIKTAIEAHRAESPTPPKNPLTMDEFNEFGQEQIDILNEHIEEIKSQLGDASFGKLDAYVKAKYHPAVAQPKHDLNQGGAAAPQNNGR